MIHPDFTILYVDNTVASTAFYRGLLGIEPVEASETFALFVLPKGLKLGLWSRHHVQPPVTATGGSAELAFLAGSKAEVDMLFAEGSDHVADADRNGLRPHLHGSGPRRPSPARLRRR